MFGVGRCWFGYAKIWRQSMIRINLNNDPSKTKSSDSFAAIDKTLKTLHIPVIKPDSGFLILAAILISLAIVPHLLFRQYQNQMVEIHKNTLAGIELELNQIKEEIKKNEIFEVEMKSIEEQEAKVSSQLNMIKQLQQARIGPLNILDAIGQSLPERIWLSSIDLNLGTNSQVQLNGKGYSSDDVSAFLLNLNKSIYFEQVNLDGVSTQKEGPQSASIKTFFVVAKPKLITDSSANIRANASVDSKGFSE